VNARRAFLAIGFSVPLLALLGFGLTRDPREIPSPLPGREAPAFALPVVRAGDGPTAAGLVPGDTARLAAHRGEVVVLNFWASWCLACRDEHEPLSRTAAAYAGRGVHFYGVLYKDTPQNGVEWIQGMGGQSYPSLEDPGSRTAIDYGLYGVPETFFIDRSGRVAYKHVGPVSEVLLAQWIDRLSAEGEAGRDEPVRQPLP
jgi:cytochrome c biogenesis protein CcmG/thiol:disulfide interchange protein DsbE